MPYCCAGSQRISDSDISDFEVDDGIGVVPPGVWVKSMALLHVFLCLLSPSISRLLWDTDLELWHREISILLFRGDLCSKLLRTFKIDSQLFMNIPTYLSLILS